MKLLLRSRELGFMFDVMTLSGVGFEMVLK